MGIVLKVIAIVLAVIAIVLLVGRPHPFTDPMTHRDGGIEATWGPMTCAVWTWPYSDPQATGFPVNCSPT